MVNVMAATEQGGGATDYILHHETNLSNRSAHGIVDFCVINYDTVFFSLLLAVVFLALFGLVARRATQSCAGPERAERGMRSASSAAVAPRRKGTHSPASLVVPAQSERDRQGLHRRARV